jgi:hypothetical protein
MSSTRQLLLCLLALVACLFTACQSGGGVKYANFPDAVTNLSQVDPEYRQYFVSQQGSNYSADDQRKALAAAIRTSRTPVPAYVPRSAMASAKKSVRQRSARSSRRAIARNKAVRSSSKTLAKRKATAKRRAVAKKKVKATRKRAVAKRRTATRRRRG